MNARWTSALPLAVLLALGAGCRQSVEPTPPAEVRPGGDPQKPGPSNASAVAQESETPILADDCPAAPPLGGEMSSQAAAAIPLKTGLTLATSWHRTTQNDDVECLTQIHDVDGGMVSATAKCSMSTGSQGGTRRTCRTDLRSAYMYYTGAGDEKAVLRGTTMFSLSQQSFAELKSTGRTRHRFVSVSDGAIIGDIDGALERQSIGTLSTIVNDRPIDVPVVRAAGTLRGTAMGKPVQTRVIASIVDDDRFPLVLDYSMPDLGAAGFSVRYTKISFPTDGQLERQLEAQQRVDVYGIYFDVNSARLRSESEPVLREIAAALQNNPSWQLAIDGHTDAAGTAAANLDLSRRRAEAVRGALVDQYRIDATRLSAEGHGATVPKSTNDTADGRARNRRVELVRR